MDAKQSHAWQVIGALIGLARATDGNEHLINPEATAIMIEGLRKTMPGGVSETEMEQLLERIDVQKRLMVPDCFHCACPCGRTASYDLSQLQSLPAQEREMKEALLQEAQMLAARVHDGSCQTAAEPLLYRALVAIGLESIRPDMLQTILQELQVLKDA